MPVITECPQCGRRLKAPDERVGKQAKCPQCKNPFTIKPASNGVPAETPLRQPEPQPPSPVAAASVASTPAVQPQPAATAPAPAIWHVQTSDGAQYGPVSKTELDAWVADDRLDCECQVLMDGWDQWKWAEEVYPQLAPAGSGSPFGQPAAVADPGGAPIVSSAPAANNNPYAAPVADAIAPAVLPPAGGDIPPAVDTLRRTRPWVLTASITSFVVGGLNALVAVVGAVRVFNVGSFLMFMQRMVNVLHSVCLSAVLIYIGLLLLKYAQACSQCARTRDMADVQSALETQRSFWKMGVIAVGIMVAVIFVSGFLVGFISGLQQALRR